MLVREMETQRQPQGTARPPILPIPGVEAASAMPAVPQPAVPKKEAQ